MGTPRFACKPLACLAESHHELLAIVTGPDEPLPRGSKTCPTPVCQEALDRGLMVFKPRSLKDKKLFYLLKELEPDLFVVVAFKILPRKLFTLPRLGSINVHGSLLPKYRGAAPINWALINGEKETGLTSFILNEKVDTGNIILQEKITIDKNDTFDSLYARMSERCGPFLLKTLERLGDKNFEPLVQDHSLSSPAPKITSENAMIDFGFPARNVVNFVRGLSSVPGAYTFFRGKRVKILGCSFVDEDSVEETKSPARPGTIIPHKKKLLIQCAGSVIEVSKIMPQGKNVIDGSSFINGYRPMKGEWFGEIPK